MTRAANLAAYGQALIARRIGGIAAGCSAIIVRSSGCPYCRTRSYTTANCPSVNPSSVRLVKKASTDRLLWETLLGETGVKDRRPHFADARRAQYFHAWRESDAWDSSALFSKKSNAGPLAFRICLLNRSKAFQFHATKRICTNVGPGCCLNGGGRALGNFSGAGMQ